MGQFIPDCDPGVDRTADRHRPDVLVMASGRPRSWSGTIWSVPPSVPDSAAGADAPDLDAPLADDRPRVLPLVPVRRFLSFTMAGLSAVLTVAMVVGVQLAHNSYALVVLGVQVFF